MPRAVAACWNFFWGVFKFLCMLLEKKSYLIGFSFKFNAIKFGNLLMNWFIQEKIFTYFYNKFRPVNRMHYIKYDVNSSLLKYFWLLQKVCGTLDHCFIMTHIIHNDSDTLQIYFCVIFRKTRNHAQPHITSGTHINCTLSLATRTHMAAEVC